jgi:hypothetical protein
MKIILFFLSSLISINAIAQVKEGFNKEEARDMVAICNSFTFIDLYNSDSTILPPGYKKLYTSGVFGMDNKFQLYQKENVVVINLRGSTDKQISWLENIYSAMIPAKGIIKISGENVPYCFAKDPAAAVHSGYALGIAYLSKDLLYHINSMNRQGIHNFIITGHSQGGSLANMLKAYLENLTHNEVPKACKFKTYSFAAPMIGNKFFSEEYNTRFCVTNTSFNIVNAADPVPTFPLSYKEGSNYFSDNLKSLLFDRESFSLKNMASDGAILLFEKKLIGLTQMLGNSASNKIAKDLGPVSLPPYVQDINYFKLNNRIEIAPVAYPKILKDSSILENDSLMAIYQKGPDGQFLNEELYEKPGMMYQHKPYNYYVSILRMYFPKDYGLLPKKYLPENL